MLVSLALSASLPILMSYRGAREVMRGYQWSYLLSKRCLGHITVSPALDMVQRHLGHMTASPALDVVQAVQRGEKTSSELVAEKLATIARTDEKLRAFITVHDSQAMAEAAALDQRIASGNEVSRSLPLAGLPIAIKDNICTQGSATTAGSRILSGYCPTYDATAVARLRAAGAIVIGKTNMDEFGMGSSTELSAYGVTRNPWDLEFSPGGSSGGSAAAVSSGSVHVSLGTDTGGSIRQPASWCGVVGFKPTYGRVSRKGLIAYASSTDCIGPIAETVTDAAAVAAVISGPDPDGDATCSMRPIDNWVEALRALEDTDVQSILRGIRIGVVKEMLSENRVQREIMEAVKQATLLLASYGAEIVEVSLPRLQQQCAAYYVNALAEASSNLARFDGMRYGYRSPTAESAGSAVSSSRHDGFGVEVRKRVIIGTFSLSAGYSDEYYKKAMAIRDSLRYDFMRAFEHSDVLLGPTTPTTAYKLGAWASKGVQSYEDDIFCVPASLAGLPAISLPCGLTSNRLPIGLQLIGEAWEENRLLAVSRAYERISKWPEVK
eukprot:68903_1